MGLGCHTHFCATASHTEDLAECLWKEVRLLSTKERSKSPELLSGCPAAVSTCLGRNARGCDSLQWSLRPQIAMETGAWSPVWVPVAASVLLSAEHLTSACRCYIRVSHGCAWKFKCVSPLWGLGLTRKGDVHDSSFQGTGWRWFQMAWTQPLSPLCANCL